jgi:hypothetical protein
LPTIQGGVKNPEIEKELDMLASEKYPKYLGCLKLNKNPEPNDIEIDLNKIIKNI